MKPIIKGLFLLFLLAVAGKSYGNHILGGSLSYDCLGGNTYGITLTYYKDCFGGTAEPAFELLEFELISGACLPFSSPLDFVSITEISDLCASEIANNSCNGGFTPGVLEVVYYAEFTLDPSCVWNITWDNGDWNYFINTDNSLIPLAYMSIDIDPSQPCLETLELTSNGAPFACVGEEIVETITFDNPNGYDLEFYFTDALTTSGASMIYEAGYSSAEPIPGITLDNLTGEMTFTAPTAFGNYVVGIQVDQYEAGIFVGSFYQYIAIVVRVCGSETIFSDPPITDVNSSVTLLDPTSLQACVGDSLCFTVNAENSNIFRLVDISSDYLTTVFSGATFSTVSDNPAIAEFCVVVDETMVGMQTLQFEAVDDACELSSMDELEINIEISPTVAPAFSDTLICANTELFIELFGDTEFNWTPIPPAIDPGFVPGAISQTFTPTESLSIEVEAVNVASYCTALDTINIEVSLSAIDTVITDESCALNDGAIDLTPIGGSGDYSYTWDLPSTDQDISGLAGGTYEVTVVDLLSADLCEISASIVVEAISPPSLTLSPDETICEGECTQIVFDFEGEEPFNIQWVNINTGDVIAEGPLNALDSIQVCPTETTSYQVQEIVDGNVPSCVDLTVYEVTITVVPEVNAFFEEPDDICIGTNGELEFNIDQAGVFDVYTSIGLFSASNGTIIPDVDVPDSPTVFTLDSIGYSAGLTCMNTDFSSVDILINELPTAELSGDTAICFGDLSASFDLQMTGIGPWEVDFTVFGFSEVDEFGYPIDDADFDFPIGITANPTEQDYCINYVYDLGSGCEQAVNTCANVVIEAQPGAAFQGEDLYQICPGEEVEEIDNDFFPSSFDLDGNPYMFDIVMQIENSQGITDSTISDVNFFNVTLSPLETTEYTFLYIIDSTGEALCSSPIDQSFTIEVFDLPTEVIPVDTICDPPGENYTVTFEIIGGDVPNYNVTGQFFDVLGDGFLIDNQYTSGSIPSGFGETWTIDDGHPCDLLTYTISAYECPIETYSGTIDTAATIDGVCEDGLYCVVHNMDEILDPNDVLSFAIIDNEDFSLANVISLSDDPCWDAATDLAFPPLNYEQTYYAVAIAGNNNGLGLVDITNTNISVSEPTAITFYEIPTATITGGGVICEGDTSQVNVQLTGFAPFEFEIYLDGILDSTVTQFDGTLFEYEVIAGSDYTINTISNEFCVGTSSGTGTVLVNPLPTALLSADGAICDGDDFDLQIDLTGTANWDLILTLEEEDGSISDVLISDIDTSPFVYAVSEAGLYSITELSDLNCLNADTTNVVELTVFDLPTAEFISADTSFCEGNNVEIEVALTGASDFDLIYEFNGNLPVIENSLIDTITLVINQNGTLSLNSIEDNNGCVNNVGSSIEITELLTPIADAGLDISVCSQTDIVIGPIEEIPFEYVWTGDISILNEDSIAQPTVNTLNSNEGIDDVYDLVLTVSNEQCFDTDEVQVTVLWEPDAEAGGEIFICSGENVQLLGEGGVNCIWQDDLSFIDATDICNPVVAPTDTTWYYLTVEAINGCFNSDSVQVFVPEPLSFEVEFDEDVCFDACDGDISVTPSGSYGDYEIDWEIVELTTFIESDLCAGVYNFTVLDSQACSIDGSVEITELIEYFLDDVIITPSNCFDGSNGEIQVVSGTAVSYSIDLPETNDTGIFEELPIGTYEVTAVNGIGCVASEIVDLTSLSESITMDISIDEITVCFEEQTDITGDATGGNGDFEYFWYDCPPSPICLIENAPTVSLNPTDDTQVWLVAIDGNGCSSDTLSSQINLAPDLFITNASNDDLEICQGECVTLSGFAGGGNGDGTITWESIDPDEVLGTDDSFEVCPMEDQLYQAVITDGCSEPFIYEVDVTVFTTPQVEILLDGEDGCFPVTVELTNLTEGDLSFQCQWNLGDGTFIDVCSSVEYTYTEPGVYTPMLTVTSENGCTGMGTLSEPIMVYDYPVVDFDWTPEQPTTLENEVQFINLSENASEYLWQIGGVGESSEISPLVSFPLVDETSYEICLTGITQQGCESELCRNLFVAGEVLVYIPNAFTPDQDGVNEIFKPVLKGIDPDNYSFRIFDRWNNKIFETNDVEGYWMGQNDLKGKEHFVAHDTYVYQIIVRKLSNDEEVVYTGHVNVIR